MRGSGGRDSESTGGSGARRAPNPAVGGYVPPSEHPRTGRTSGRIVDQLRGLIRSGQLPLGERLPPERELCERYGVSRVTVREALRVLEAGGLVDIRLGSHGGAFVTAPAAQRAAGAVDDYFTLTPLPDGELAEARRVLELGVVPLACERADTQDLERLSQACDALERAQEGGDSAWPAAREFHLNLARAGRNHALEVLIWPLLGASAGEQPSSDFRRLLDAVRDRDSHRATEILREQLG